VTTEQLREKAGDYEAAAVQLSEKYKIKVYTGQTGLLSPVDMQSDQTMATLFLQGYGRKIQDQGLYRPDGAAQPGRYAIGSDYGNSVFAGLRAESG